MARSNKWILKLCVGGGGVTDGGDRVTTCSGRIRHTHTPRPGGADSFLYCISRREGAPANPCETRPCPRTFYGLQGRF